MTREITMDQPNDGRKQFPLCSIMLPCGAQTLIRTLNRWTAEFPNDRIITYGAIENGQDVLAVFEAVNAAVERDRAALQAHKDVIITVRDRVAKLKKEGKTVEQIVASKPTADLDAKVGSAAGSADRFVQQLFAELYAQPLDASLIARRAAEMRADAAEAEAKKLREQQAAEAARKIGIDPKTGFPISDWKPPEPDVTTRITGAGDEAAPELAGILGTLLAMVAAAISPIPARSSDAATPPASSSPAAPSVRSAPEQKASSAPVMTRARSARSASTWSKTSSSSTHIVGVIAFFLRGRFSVTVTTPSARSTVMVSTVPPRSGRARRSPGSPRRYRSAVGFNPTRRGSVRPSEIATVVAAALVIAVLLVWAFGLT